LRARPTLALRNCIRNSSRKLRAEIAKQQDVNRIQEVGTCLHETIIQELPKLEESIKVAQKELIMKQFC
jgi:lipopolysaccharide/colanic/teichoic acid biosynthesis glycosyltransferase